MFFLLILEAASQAPRRPAEEGMLAVTSPPALPSWLPAGTGGMRTGSLAGWYVTLLGHPLPDAGWLGSGGESHVPLPENGARESGGVPARRAARGLLARGFCPPALVLLLCSGARHRLFPQTKP